MRLFPRRYEKQLFDLFADTAHLIADGAEALSRTLGEDPHDRARLAARLHEHATEATALDRRITNRLAEALITPFEAEVLHAMSLAMTDVLAAMERTADLVARFRLGSIPVALLESAELISRAADITVEAAWHLGEIDRLREYVAAMRRLGTHAERLARGALAELFDSSLSAGEMMRLREVCIELRAVMRHFETVARTADLLRIKDS